MNRLVSKVKHDLADPLWTFKVFERFIALFCNAMPLILWLADGGPQQPFRPSISNYVYMQKGYVYGLLLCIAAMLFIYNGVVYYRCERHLRISWHGQWYNVVLGLSLIGVIIFPHLEHPIPHYFFAVLFFAGNAVVTGLFYKDKDRKKSLALAVLTLIAFPLAFANVISLLAAEWLSLFVIGVHFIFSTIDMNKPVTEKKQRPKA